MRRGSTATAATRRSFAWSLARNDFLGRSPPALYRAVHIALPLDARVLAGEEQTAERPGEPRAQRRIVRGIEEGVAAARPRGVVPSHLTRCDEIGMVRPVAIGT